MLRPSVGVLGLEGLLEESEASSFSGPAITISLSEKALIEEIGRARPERPELGKRVLDV